MEISVIIPTLNEEELLPGLLEDLRRQSFDDFEIVVADAGSTDRTGHIARDHSARVVDGGLPPVGRNRGAAAASGKFLFFLDADVRLPEDFLEKAHNEIEDRFLDLATCDVDPLSDHPADRLLYDFTNFAIKLAQFSDPHAHGFCILVSHRLFDRVGGFDESIKIAEDHDFVKRASQFRPLRVLQSARISVSVRRLEKEGRAGLVNKYLAVELHRALFGEVREDFVEYEFGGFEGQEPEADNGRLSESRALMDRLQEDYSTSSADLGDTADGERLEEMRRQFEHLKDQLKSMLTVR